MIKKLAHSLSEISTVNLRGISDCLSREILQQLHKLQTSSIKSLNQLHKFILCLYCATL